MIITTMRKTFQNIQNHEKIHVIVATRIRQTFEVLTAKLCSIVCKEAMYYI